MAKQKFQRLSVIVPDNPFASSSLKEKRHCLCAMDVEKLMEWWPGTPHSPHRDAEKVRNIQRSLDWNRVAQIASYLLQQEIIDVPDRLNHYFNEIYQPKKTEPGREWPPKVKKVVGFTRSVFPTFSNVLIHVNGAKINTISGGSVHGAANLVFDENDKKLRFSVIDGQHRINGAYFAIKILKESDPSAKWEIPSEIFLDLDDIDAPPSIQAQIFIDVNSNQKKVDRSLVADLYPTARVERESLDQKERAQDIGRKLMLEVGPLVGMIQIPGIKFGVKDVITLATLNGAVEDILDILEQQNIMGLEIQTDFIAQCLTAWFEASGRFEKIPLGGDGELNPNNVAYQGRILVSVIDLLPAMIWRLKKQGVKLVSDKALDILTKWLSEIINKSNLFDGKVFISKDKFKELGYLGSGGIGRFRDTLWATVIGNKKLNKRTKVEKIAEQARVNKAKIWSELKLK